MDRSEQKPMNPKLKEGLGYIIISILLFILGWFFFEWHIADVMQGIFIILSALLVLASWTPISDFIREWRYKRIEKNKK